MSFDGLHSFLQKIDTAVRDLRTALEANDMDRLPNALELTNAALESINGYPGGAEKLRGDINEFPEDQKERLLSLGLEPNPQGPQALNRLIQADSKRWSKLIQETGIKAE